MKRIAVIGGDGIGPEVTQSAVRVLEAASPANTYAFVELPYSADYTLETGVTISEAAFERLGTDYDAILLGALGDPRIPDQRHARDVLLGCRMRHDLFINLRPVKLISDHLTPLKGKTTADLDFVILRENTEGLYVNIGGTMREGTPYEVASNQLVATRRGTERIVRAAYEYARKHGRGKVCMVSKHNAVTYAHGLWDRVYHAVREDYPDIESTKLFADVAAMEFVRCPEQFEVVVCSNLLGDVLSDLGAQLVGGLGLAPSANVHPGKLGLFEPVHGSAPDIAGTGRANPIAAVASAAMMARYLDLDAVGRRIDDAIRRVIQDGATTPDLGGSLNTVSATDAIIERL